MSLSPENSSKRQPPLSLRLTFAERALLEKKAGGQSLSGYIKNELFGGTGATPAFGLSLGASSRRVGTKDRLLAQILAKLGESELGPSMNELAQAARSGSLYVNDLVESQLVQACADIAELRLLLLEALGKRRTSPLPTPHNTTEAFNLAASGRIKPRTLEHYQ